MCYNAAVSYTHLDVYKRQDRKIVVPGKTLGEISKILSGEIDDQVNIYFTKNHILFEFDQTIVAVSYTHLIKSGL